VNKKPLIIYSTLIALGGGSLAVAPTVSAGVFNFMNPSKWFGNDRRYYDDDYYYDRYRYGRGWGGYGPYGYGPGWGGYGPYGYGLPYGGWPGYGYSAPKSESPPPPPLPQ